MKNFISFLSIGAIGTIATAAVVSLALSTGCTSDPDDGENPSGNGGSGNNPGNPDGGEGANGSGTGNSGGGGGNDEPGDHPIDEACGYKTNPRTVADIADKTDEGQAVRIIGAIATTKTFVASFTKNKGSCLWAFFVKDPDTNRGLMIYRFGDNAPVDSDLTQCPKSSQANKVPFDIQPGDIVDIGGKTVAYAPAAATAKGLPKQRQVKLCAVKKQSSGSVSPVVVTDLGALVEGNAAYQGLLVQINNPEIEYVDGGKVLGPYGVIKVKVGDGRFLEVHNKFFYVETGSQQFDNNTTFQHIIGISHLDYDNWVIQPRDRCTDFSPQSTVGCN